MKLIKYTSLFCLFLLAISSCSKNSYLFKVKNKNKAALGDNVTVTLEQVKGGAVDSIQLFAGTKQLSLKDNKSTFNTSDLGVGKHKVTAMVFLPNKVEKFSNSIEIVANKVPDLYNAKIIKTYPHDVKAYTQGLEYYNGFLYETTGRNGESWLRKIEIPTGKVLQQYDLDDKYFGEGMTIVGDKIYWLTWQAGKGFVFDLNTFKLIKEFPYQQSEEGWGLTHTDTELIKSDGTNKIWFLNPANQKEKRHVQVYTHKEPLKQLNELEYIDGKIYANYWQKPLIAIINPENGSVEGIINLKNVVKEMAKEQKLVDQDDVLNGIAYDPENKRLFVTGKHWGKIFEIEIIKQ